MKKPSVSKLVKVGVTALIGGLIAWFALSLRGFTGAEEPAEKYRLLCDAFTFPGLLLILVGALVALSNEGAFLGLGYVVSFALRGLIPGLGSKQETYAEYLERKTEKGRVTGYGFLFIVGGFYFLLALVFLVLFNKSFPG